MVNGSLGLSTIAEFSLAIGLNYREDEAIARFKTKRLKEFDFWGEDAADLSCSCQPGELRPGANFRGVLLGIEEGTSISPEMCFAIATKHGAVNTGAQGLTLAYRHMTTEHLPKLVGKRVISMPAKSNLPESVCDRKIPSIWLPKSSGFHWCPVNYTESFDAEYVLMLFIPRPTTGNG